MILLTHFFSSDCIDTLVEKYDIQKTSLLRSLCKKVGIQVMLKEYNMDKTKQAFSEEDILNVFPIVKHIAPKVITVEYVYIINKFFLRILNCV